MSKSKNLALISANIYSDVSGNIGIGTTSPVAKLHISDTSSTIMSEGKSGYGSFTAKSAAGNNSYYFFQGPTAERARIAADDNGVIYFNNGASNTNRMMIDGSGNILIGTSGVSTNPAKGVNVIQNANYSSIAIGHDSGVATGTSYGVFSYNSATIGSITQNGTTGVLFNTASDHRLKEIDGPVTASGDFIDALNPVVGSWKIDGSPFVGFIAHEFQAVSPSSVIGEKDAVDEDGAPILQTMQASSPEVMANVVAELQFLRKRVTSLEEEITYLKAA